MKIKKQEALPVLIEIDGDWPTKMPLTYLQDIGDRCSCIDGNFVVAGYSLTETEIIMHVETPSDSPFRNVPTVLVQLGKLLVPARINDVTCVNERIVVKGLHAEVRSIHLDPIANRITMKVIEN